MKKIFRHVVTGILLWVCLGWDMLPAFANIIVKVMAINPSSTEEQVVEVKAYLPKEIKTEDVIDSGGLELIYDPQQGAYFVYGEYTLAPAQTREFEIELRDVWVIPEEEINSLVSEVEKTVKLLEATDFKERARFIKEGIDQKLKEIKERQKESAANAERHISNYRENLKVMEAIKSDLLLMRSFLAQARSLPRVSVWKLFLAIVLFLGVLSVLFYVVWHSQVKLIEKEIPKNNQTVSK